MIFRWADGKTDFEGSRFVRKKVFVEEQGFQEALEFDEIDDTARHLTLCTETGETVATARLFPDSSEKKQPDGTQQGRVTVWHIGRICVLNEYRGQHLGAAILAEAEQEVRRLGGKRLVLGAQQRAAGFYEKCGYRVCGAEYMDEFCPHVEMGKDLT